MRAIILMLFGVFAPQTLWAGTICDALLRRDASVGIQNASCFTSLRQGGAVQETCYWAFDYRSAASAEKFNSLHNSIAGCIGAEDIMKKGAKVNHPDSYEQRRYEGQGIRVSLALKDKAGLSQSLIFLSISPEP